MTSMPSPEAFAEHATLTLERVYDAAPGRVFAAWADPDARARWGAPTDGQEVVYLESDFRVGGRDFSCCGPRGHPVFTVEARYEDIVDGRRIVFTETVCRGEHRLSAALVSVEIVAEGLGARLRLVNQIASFTGVEMISGARTGWTAALANLAADLACESAPA